MPNCGAPTSRGGKCRNKAGSCPYHAGGAKTCQTYMNKRADGRYPDQFKIGRSNDAHARAKQMGQRNGREYEVVKVVRGPCRDVERIVHTNLRDYRMPCKKACKCGCRTEDGGCEWFRGDGGHFADEMDRVNRMMKAMSVRRKR